MLMVMSLGKRLERAVVCFQRGRERDKDRQRETEREREREREREFCTPPSPYVPVLDDLAKGQVVSRKHSIAFFPV